MTKSAQMLGHCDLEKQLKCYIFMLTGLKGVMESFRCNCFTTGLCSETMQEPLLQVLQASVNSDFMFQDVYCNTPGSAHDATVYLRSPLFGFLSRKMPQNNKLIQGREVPLHLLGDPAYPISPYIIKGFVDWNLTDKQENFNAYNSSARMCVEIAFGRLKSRWRVLSKRIDMHCTFVPKVVTACCILNNICERVIVNSPTHLQYDLLAFPQPNNLSDDTVDREAVDI